MVPGRNVTSDRPRTVAEGEPPQRLSVLALTSLTTPALLFLLRKNSVIAQGPRILPLGLSDGEVLWGKSLWPPFMVSFLLSHGFVRSRHSARGCLSHSELEHQRLT